MSLLLIAESGGTKTDWRLINRGLVEDSFVTDGLHPDSWNDSTWIDLEQELIHRVDLKAVRLEFYGAGCYRDPNKTVMFERFQSLGFKDVSVLSDLHAAGKAVYNNGSGWVAIMGTGSVLFYYDQGQIGQIIGGKGHITGDEGSGYYFGKLVYEDYLNGQLNNQALKILENVLGSKTLQSLTISNKNELARIAAELSTYSAEFDDYHRKNFTLFTNSHLKAQNNIKSLGIVGGYAFFHQNILENVLKAYNIEIQNIIARPIDHLVEQITSEN